MGSIDQNEPDEVDDEYRLQAKFKYYDIDDLNTSALVDYPYKVFTIILEVSSKMEIVYI